MCKDCLSLIFWSKLNSGLHHIRGVFVLAILDELGLHDLDRFHLIFCAALFNDVLNHVIAILIWNESRSAYV